MSETWLPPPYLCKGSQCFYFPVKWRGKIYNLIDSALTVEERDILEQQDLTTAGRFPCRFPLVTWRCSVPLQSVQRNYQKEPPHWCLCTRRRYKISATRSLFYGCQICWFSYDLWSWKMLKGDKQFAHTVPCNTGLSNQSHCSHFQIKTGLFCHLHF